jgi:hypothetical protein
VQVATNPHAWIVDSGARVYSVSKAGFLHLRNGKERDVLDSFIIDRIRRERERARESAYVPLRIEPPPPPSRLPDDERDRSERESPAERGSVVIDFQL